MLASPKIEGRRWFELDEKKNTLKRSRNKCCCCGKKLTLQTMTMEHIVPVSRGGKNEPENLIALCKECNQLKGNMLYRPEGFYLAMIHDPIFFEVRDYFAKWFDTIYKDFEIAKYPLISPEFICLFVPPGCKVPTRNNLVISKQLMLNWSYIGKDKYEEMEAITGQNVKQLRMDTNFIKYHEYKNDTVAIYSMKKVSNEKYLALFSVLLDREDHTAQIYMPWHDMSKAYLPWCIYFFTQYLLDSLCIYAHEDIDVVYLYANTIETFAYFNCEDQDANLGIGCTAIHDVSKSYPDIPGAKYELDIIRTKKGYQKIFGVPKETSKYADIPETAKNWQEELQTRKQIAEQRYAEAHADT